MKIILIGVPQNHGCDKDGVQYGPQELVENNLEDRLREKGIPLIPHRAIQMTRQDYLEYDYLIGMDTANIRNMNKIACGDSEGKIYKLLSFAGEGRDVADPWYTGDFAQTWDDINEGCRRILEEFGC